MGISVPVLIGLGSLLALSPVVIRQLNKLSGKPPRKSTNEKESKDNFWVPVVADKVSDIIADTVITKNKITYAVVGALCALLVAVVKVNEK